MTAHYNSWRLITINDSSWRLHDDSWWLMTLMTTHEGFMMAHDDSWQLMTILWLLMAIHDSSCRLHDGSWRFTLSHDGFMTAHDNSWRLMTILDTSWRLPEYPVYTLTDREFLGCLEILSDLKKYNKIMHMRDHFLPKLGDIGTHTKLKIYS